MIFADKLIQLRKKAGWSQEELAEQMKVSRQSVSKWEGAQAVPDLQKILQLSELFGVSTDYLLKDSIEETEGLEVYDETSDVRRISMEEANTFLQVKEETAVPIAIGVFLCILSPICLMILGAMSEAAAFGLSEGAAGGIGMIVLFLLVAIAVAVFVACDSKTNTYDFLEKEVFETEYGVTGMVKERKARYKEVYDRNNLIGTVLCVLSVLPLFVGTAIDEDNDLLLVCMLALLLLLVGIGVIFFVRSGIVWGSYQQLLQEGDYTKKKKEKSPIATAVYVTYWVVVTAFFLIYTGATGGNWKYTGMIWAVAGVLFPAVAAITNVLTRKK